jgi:hypothetical protein
MNKWQMLAVVGLLAWAVAFVWLSIFFVARLVSRVLRRWVEPYRGIDPMKGHLPSYEPAWHDADADQSRPSGVSVDQWRNEVG